MTKAILPQCQRATGLPLRARGTSIRGEAGLGQKRRTFRPALRGASPVTGEPLEPGGPYPR